MAQTFPHLPLAKARPDARRFIDVIMGRTRSERPPLVEYLVDDALRRPITTELLGRAWVDPATGDRASTGGLPGQLYRLLARPGL